MHEVRFSGAFIQLFESEKDGKDYIAQHEGDLDHAKRFTLEPARPFRVLCRGNLVETCETANQARAFIKEKASDDEAPETVWEVIAST